MNTHRCPLACSNSSGGGVTGLHPPVLTLDAVVLLVLDDEVLLAVLQLTQLVLRLLGGQPQLLEGLIDLLVALGQAVQRLPRTPTAGLGSGHGSMFITDR